MFYQTIYFFFFERLIRTVTPEICWHWSKVSLRSFHFEISRQWNKFAQTRGKTSSSRPRAISLGLLIFRRQSLHPFQLGAEQFLWECCFLHHGSKQVLRSVVMNAIERKNKFTLMESYACFIEWILRCCFKACVYFFINFKLNKGDTQRPARRVPLRACWTLVVSGFSASMYEQAHIFK